MEHETFIPGGYWDEREKEQASVLPADVDVAVLSEQDVDNLSGVQQQIVLNVSGLSCGGDSLLTPPVVSGETYFEVGQGAARHQVLQLLSGTRRTSLSGQFSTFDFMKYDFQ